MRFNVARAFIFCYLRLKRDVRHHRSTVYALSLIVPTIFLILAHRDVLVDVDSVNALVLPAQHTESPMTFVIACAADQEGAMKEVRPLLVSMILLASRPLHFVFLTDARGSTQLQNLFAKELTYSKRHLRVDIHQLVDGTIESWAKSIKVNHKVGRYQLLKMMVPWILPSLSRIAVLDTDMVFVEDPYNLWKTSSDRAYTMPLADASGVNNICSCVVLINCDLARKMQVYPDLVVQSLQHSTARNIRRWFNNRTGLWTPRLADQGLYWLLLRKHPSLFQALPEKWNIERCHGFYGALIDGSRKKVGLLHRNCAGRDSTAQHDSASPYFDFFLAYKWPWLRAEKSRGFNVQVNVHELSIFFETNGPHMGTAQIFF